MAEQPYKYWAFISYSHQDRAWANWLHKSLETYRVPHRLVGREHWSGPLPRRLMPIFRDRDELPSSAELGSVLNEALQQSRYLIVICSPQSARSRWVNEEVKYFKSLGRAQRVLPLIVGGEPNATDMPNSGLVECLPPAIRFEVDGNGQLTDRRAEPIAADARGEKDGRATAKLKLIAGLIGVGLDELRQRERQRKILQRILGASTAITLTLLAGIGWHWQQNEKQHALEAQAMKVRIAQLYENGRQELLAHNEARAAVYLNEAYKLGVDTPALRYMLARAMRTVDAQALRVNIGGPAVLVNLSSDGKKFLAVDKNSRLSTWDAESGEKLGSYNLDATTESVSAAFSPRDSFIWVDVIQGSEPRKRLKILDANGNRALAEFTEGYINAGAASPMIDAVDEHLVYLKENYSIAVYSTDKKKERFISGRYSVVAVCRDSDSIIAGTANGTVFLFDRDTGALQREFTGLRGAVTALESSSGCKTLVAGTAEGALRVWDSATGAVLMTGGSAQAIGAIQVNAQGTRLASLTLGSVNVWKMQDGALLYAGKFLDPLGSTAAMSPDGMQLATLHDARLSLLSPSSATDMYSLDGHQGAATNFNFSEATHKFISGGADGTVVIWNLPSEAKANFRFGDAKDSRVSNYWEPAEAQARFNYEGSQIFAGGNDGTGGLWRADLLQKTAKLAGHKASLSAAAYSVDDKILATGGRDQSLRFWDAASGAELSHLDHLGGYVNLLLFDSSNRFASVSVQDQGATLRSVPEGTPLIHFETDYSRAQSFSPKDATYAVGTHGVVKLWDISKRAYRWSRPLFADGNGAVEVTTIKFSPDGERILATASQNRAFILDSRNGNVLQQIYEPAASGLYVSAFSPDGRLVAFGDHGKSVLIWQLATNNVLMSLGHIADIRGVAFSPDSTLLASVGGDGMLKIWDAKKGELLDSISAHENAASWDGVQFSPQGNQILSSGSDNVARLWDVQKESRNPEQIAALLRCRVAWRVSGSMLSSVAPESQGCTTH